ncbi:MqnA/MqnD/SBP family protein [Caldiplasma sukawensis]
MKVSLSEHFEVEANGPRTNLEKLKNGQLDYGMVALVKMFAEGDDLKIVKGPTITGKIHSMSNLLISNGQKMYNGMQIAVTSETDTTSFYLSLILDKYFPDSKMIICNTENPDKLLQESDFALVIGDNALSVYRSNYTILMDISYMITKIYEIPPVYAVTATRSGGGLDERMWNVDAHIYRDVICNFNENERNLMDYYYRSISYEYNRSTEQAVRFFRNIYLEKNRIIR